MFLQFCKLQVALQQAIADDPVEAEHDPGGGKRVAADGFLDIGAEQADQNRRFQGLSGGAPRARRGQRDLAEKIAAFEQGMFTFPIVLVMTGDPDPARANDIHARADVPLAEDHLLGLIIADVDDIFQKGEIAFVQFVERRDRAEEIGQGFFVTVTAKNVLPKWVHDKSLISRAAVSGRG